MYVCIKPFGDIDSSYIYDQSSSNIGSKKLGITTVSHGGCGPVATYNAMQILGRSDVTFDDVIDYYEDNDELILGGLLGFSPYACVDYFQDNGYSVIATKEVAAYEELAKTADACILWCWFDTSAFPGVGAHFIAFEECDGGALYYNAYSGMRTPYYYAGSCYSFVGDYSGCCPVLILIYDT